MNEILCMIKNHLVNTLETNLISVDELKVVFLFFYRRTPHNDTGIDEVVERYSSWLLTAPNERRLSLRTRQRVAPREGKLQAV